MEKYKINLLDTASKLDASIYGCGEITKLADAIVQENLKKMDEMQKEREQSISDREIDSIMKQRYGNNYRTEQSANINGWNFK